MLSLVRIVDLASGSILLGGVDIRALSLQCLRRTVAVVAQHPVLFSGTVRDNLDPDERQTDQRLLGVLGALGVAVALEEPVKEAGNGLALGLRQQLCIARAALGNPSVLVLDEATASLDSSTEALVLAFISQRFTCTTLSITHQVKTAARCSLVLVLEAGRLVEFGSPSTLLHAAGSAFAGLAAAQQ